MPPLFVLLTCAEAQTSSSTLAVLQNNLSFWPSLHPTPLTRHTGLNVLRNAIEFLGGFWRHHAPDVRLHAGLPIVEELSSDEDIDDRLRRASFVICVPGYTLERLVIEVRFPASLPDVLPHLKQARQRGPGLQISTSHPCIPPAR